MLSLPKQMSNHCLKCRMSNLPCPSFCVPIKGRERPDCKPFVPSSSLPFNTPRSTECQRCLRLNQRGRLRCASADSTKTGHAQHLHWVALFFLSKRPHFAQFPCSFSSGTGICVRSVTRSNSLCLSLSLSVKRKANVPWAESCAGHALALPGKTKASVDAWSSVNVEAPEFRACGKRAPLL